MAKPTQTACERKGQAPVFATNAQQTQMASHRVSRYASQIASPIEGVTLNGKPLCVVDDSARPPDREIMEFLATERQFMRRSIYR